MLFRPFHSGLELSVPQFPIHTECCLIRALSEVPLQKLPPKGTIWPKVIPASLDTIKDIPEGPSQLQSSWADWFCIAARKSALHMQLYSLIPLKVLFLQRSVHPRVCLLKNPAYDILHTSKVMPSILPTQRFLKISH